MTYIPNASTLPVAWLKSSHSDAGAQCVEYGILDADPGLIAIRDSKNPTGPALLFSTDAVNSFIAAVKAGQFNQQ
jgi:Domain of unknown function (DUF397)